MLRHHKSMYHGTIAGETSIQQANQKRFEDRVQQLFKQFKEQRLTQAALQCEELINKASNQLTQVSANAALFMLI